MFFAEILRFENFYKLLRDSKDTYWHHSGWNQIDPSVLHLKAKEKYINMSFLTSGGLEGKSKQRTSSRLNEFIQNERMCRRENRYGAHSDEVPRKLIITRQRRVAKGEEFHQFVTDFSLFSRSLWRQSSFRRCQLGGHNRIPRNHEIFIPKLSWISLSCFFVESIECRAFTTRKNNARALEGGEGRVWCPTTSSIDFGLITGDSEGPPEIRAHQTHPHEVHLIEPLHDSPNIKQHEPKAVSTRGSSWCEGNSFRVFRKSIQKSELIVMEGRKSEKRLEV